jgi:hypothetical protein
MGKDIVEHIVSGDGGAEEADRGGLVVLEYHSAA